MFHSFINQAFKRLIAREHDTDRSCEIRKECKTHEFYNHAKQKFICGATSKIAIADGCNSCEDKVKSIDINLKYVGIYCLLGVSGGTYLIAYKTGDPAFSLADADPHAGHDMGNKADRDF